MMGMEKMLAGMIGLSPEQLQQMATGISQTASDGVAMLKTITEQNRQILAQLERLENGNRNNAD